MTASKSQSDSARDKTASVSQPENSRQSNAPVTPSAHDKGRGHTQLPSDQPSNGRTNSTPKPCIKDHPEWSSYLAARHILEPAIAAGVRVEREDLTGQEVLIWQTKRRDGSQGATRRRLLKQLKRKGKKQSKVRWQYGGQKTDEPFYYVGTLEDLRREIARAGGKVYIVEGEIDVWSLHRLGIRNVIGIYGIGNIPRDIGVILDEIGAASFVYLADNDKAGDDGAAKLATLLLQSGWGGEGEFRKVTGPGIPEKGDANDLLCHHFPNIPAARAALDTLPTFLPRIDEPEPAPRISVASGYNDPRWDPVKEAVRIALGVTDYNHKGFSKKFFHCYDLEHDDDDASAQWHRDGFCKCHGCGKTFNAKQMAEFLHIPWRTLLGTTQQIRSSDNIDLNAAPRDLETAPIYKEAPDSLLRLSNKLHTTMHSSLYYTATRLRSAGLLPEAFSVQEFIDAAPTLGCELKDRAIYDNFEDARHGDDHPLFAKLDPSERAQSWDVKFRLRSVADIQERLLSRLRFRVYEKEFQSDPDTIIGFEVFAAAPLRSESAKALELALEPLLQAQKQRYERLVRKCEDIIARHKADLV